MPAKTATARSEVYYTTSYAFSTSSTSTMALVIWKALSEHLTNHQTPMTSAELSAASGVEEEALAAIFGQTYYQRFYGFRRFDSLDAWTEWARSSGVLYVPELHDTKPEPEVEDEVEEEE